MAELTISQIIKIVIAVAVIAVVIFGVYMAFKYYIIPYFRGWSFNSSAEMLMVLLK